MSIMLILLCKTKLLQYAHELTTCRNVDAIPVQIKLAVQIKFAVSAFTVGRENCLARNNERKMSCERLLHRLRLTTRCKSLQLYAVNPKQCHKISTESVVDQKPTTPSLRSKWEACNR
jgi:hypothetical protein